MPDINTIKHEDWWLLWAFEDVIVRLNIGNILDADGGELLYKVRTEWQ